MPALPPVSDFTGATRTNAEMKVTHAGLHAYLVGLLGSDGAPGTALATLGALTAPGQTQRSAATTLVPADRGRLFTVWGTWAMTLPLASAAGAGWSVLVHNWGTGTITLTRAGTDVIDGAATAPVVAGMAVLLICTGTEWITLTLATGHARGALLRSADVTTSATDATAGRLLKVGDHGLGGLTPLRGNISVTDNSLPTGLYNYDTFLGSTGGPANVTRGSLIHTRRNAGGGETQMLVVESATGTAILPGMVFTRSRVSAAWSDWRWPGIAESATNANGRYIRHQDGTQICWQIVTTATGGEVAATFPAAFSTTTDLRTTLGVNAAVALALAPRFTGRTTTGMNVSCFNTSNARVATAVEAVTIGRWF